MLRIFLLKLKLTIFLLSIWIYSHLVFFWSWNKVYIFDWCSKIILIIEIVCICTFLSVYVDGLTINIGLKLFVNWLTLVILIWMYDTVFLSRVLILILDWRNVYIFVCVFLWCLKCFKLNFRLRFFFFKKLWIFW